MDSKLSPIAPNIYDMNSIYAEYCINFNKTASPEIWHGFLKKCGLQHSSLSRLEIVNRKKWMLAKIKYGI
jgi:hypothetical protein